MIYIDISAKLVISSTHNVTVFICKSENQICDDRPLELKNGPFLTKFDFFNLGISRPAGNVYIREHRNVKTQLKSNI